MTGYTSALGAQILTQLEDEKDTAILQIQTEGAAQVAAASDEADRAEAAAGEAVQSAAYAGGFETPEYASQSAGNTATTAGQIFRVPIGTTPQTFNWYRRLSSGSELVDPLATSGVLAGSGGSGQIGFKQSSTASLEYLDAVVRRIGFYPQSYGATADGITDDADEINAANDAAELVGGKLVLDGTFLIKKQLKISVPIDCKAGAKLIVAADFDNTGVGTVARSAIVNKYFAAAYNSSTALPFEISGRLEVEIRSTTDRQCLTLANVNGGALDQPYFWTNTSARIDAIIDFYACCRGIDVYNPDIANVTLATGGGCFWIRNITSDGANVENDTRGIRLHGGRLRHATGDEALAVYGVFGKTRGVRVNNLTVESLIDAGTGTRHSTLISAFPLNLTGSSSVAQGSLNAAVEDVVFDGLRIYDKRFKDHVYRTGKSEDKFNICQNIHFINSIIEATQTEVRTSYMARHIPCVGTNVTINNLVAIADNVGQIVTSGVAGFDSLTQSEISGKVTSAVSSVKSVRNNKRLIGLSYAVDACPVVVSNDYIAAPAYPIQARTTEIYTVARNKIVSTNTSGAAGGILINSVGGTAVPNGSFEGNDYDATNNTSATLAVVSGTIGTSFDVMRNRGIGSGAKTLSSQLRRVEGNDRFGSPDPTRQTLPGDASVTLIAAGFQTVVFNTAITDNRTVTAPSSGVIDGQRVRIIRTSNATGAFSVIFSGGSLTTTGWMNFERINGAWVKTGQGV